MRLGLNELIAALSSGPTDGLFIVHDFNECIFIWYNRACENDLQSADQTLKCNLLMGNGYMVKQISLNFVPVRKYISD